MIIMRRFSILQARQSQNSQPYYEYLVLMTLIETPHRHPSTFCTFCFLKHCNGTRADVWWANRKTLLKANQQQLNNFQHCRPTWGSVDGIDHLTATRIRDASTEPLWQLIWLVDNNCYNSIVAIFCTCRFILSLRIYSTFH